MVTRDCETYLNLFLDGMKTGAAIREIILSKVSLDSFLAFSLQCIALFIVFTRGANIDGNSYRYLTRIKLFTAYTVPKSDLRQLGIRYLTCSCPNFVAKRVMQLGL